MSRPRVVLDTNVVISAVLFGGVPRKVLDLAISGAIECSVSGPLLEELAGVLGRPKFGIPTVECLHIIEEYQSICGIVEPSARITVIAIDPADNRVLECATESRAEFIVTGDTHLIELGEYRGVEILNPADFLRRTGL